MKTLSLSPVVAAGVAVAVQMNHDQAFADTVTFTNGTSLNNSSAITMPISPDIVNADELLSISGGSAFGEGSTFEILADYANGTQQVIYSTTVNPPGINLSTVSDKPLAEGTIDGLTFENTGGTGSRAQSVPTGTIFTFDVTPTPEPATLTLAALGATGLWLAARRRAGQKD